MLAGADAASFEIQGSELHLKAGRHPPLITIDDLPLDEPPPDEPTVDDPSVDDSASLEVDPIDETGDESPLEGSPRTSHPRYRRMGSASRWFSARRTPSRRRW